MSGVILEDGTQFEHCNVCGDFVLIQSLHYEPPGERHEHGRDVCQKCWLLSPEERDEVAQAVHDAWLARELETARAAGWDAVIQEGRVLVTGPVTRGDRVLVPGDHRGTVASIDMWSDDVWVRLDTNAIPIGERGCVERFARRRLVRL